MRHEEMMKYIQPVFKQAQEVQEAKNIRYNNSFANQFIEWGLPSTAIRLTDKLERFKSVAKEPELETEDETLRDTLIDMANYALMTVAMLDYMADQESPNPPAEEEEPVVHEPEVLTEEEVEAELEELTKDQLKELAKHLEVKVGNKDSKEVIISKIIEEEEPDDILESVDELFPVDHDEE